MSQNSYESYSNVFLTAHPKDGLYLVQEKQRQGNILDDELAQYFKERALIEDQYAKSLVKASKRIYVMDNSALGGLAPIWELLLDELTEISTAHGILSYKIMEEIEKPLKIPAATNDIDKIKSLEPTFQQLAKDYEAGIKQKKSGKSSLFKSGPKLQSENILSKWKTEGSSFLQLYENVERARLQRLKSMLENFEQFRKDQLLKSKEIADRTLTAASLFDVENDIRLFCKSKSSHLTSLPPTATVYKNNSGNESAINPSPPSMPTSNDLPRKTTEKKQRSRFSLLRKSRKPSSSPKKDDQRISAISETAEQEDRSHENEHNIVSDSLSTSPADLSTEQQDKFIHTTPAPPSASDSMTHMKNTTNQIIDKAKIPPVDSEGYSIPFPDSFGHTITNTGVIPLEEQSNPGSLAISGSQKLKFDIKDKSVLSHGTKTEQENATLSRVSSLLRESTPTISQKRRGRRQNMRIQSSYMESGPPSPLSSINENTAIRGGVNVGSTISNTSDSTNNPFRQLTPTSEHTNMSSISPSPSSSHDMIPLPLSTKISASQSHQPTFHVSIVETVNMLPGQTKANIMGQIKMVYEGPSLSHDQPFIIRINNIQDVQPANESIQPVINTHDTFILPISIFEDVPYGIFIPLFNYQQERSAEEVLPMILEPAWRISNDSVMLMVKYKVTDQMAIIAQQGGRVMVLVNLSQSNIMKAQSTPEGIWNQQQQSFTWKHSEIMQHDLIASGNQQPRRLLAKFTTSNDNARMETPTISLKYYCHDLLVSDIELASWIQQDGNDNNKIDILMEQRMVKSGSILLA
ncbi:uncharacterized protein BX664DRAFT_335411 [Halteromyces radiatus]|uniref:uncharacterized protein n=1 Tax=Halteromyces radiatus TaxID=101107 RepID=UPI00221F03C1|nr:uncharacterized protein BX664DRAFT_335411 [Halteromyces radiatus]KAI8086280.1 hypothetical protein BX664DRAFT_335411 [Halteromyces radiatus]